MDHIFRDAVTEAKSLVQAETITLFLLRDTRSPDNEDDGWHHLYTAIPGFDGGKYMWAKYADGKITSLTDDSGAAQSERFKCREIRVPFGRGIMNRVIRTGEAINLENPLKDPAFDRELSVRGDETRHLMIVPVKNARGDIIGLLQAVNKQPPRQRKRRKSHVVHVALDDDDFDDDYKDDDEDDDDPAPLPPQKNTYRGFTEGDVQILQALASHLSVYLRNASDEDEKLCLKDTIRLLKRHTVKK